MTTRRSEAHWDENMKRWHIKVQKDGDRRSFYSSTKGRTGKHEAEAQADEWLESNTAKDVNLRQAWDQYLATKKPPLRKQDTYNKLESHGRVWILPVVGENKKLSRITPEQWQKVLNSMVKEGHGKNTNGGISAKRTIMNVRADITAFCKWARYVKRWPIEIPMMLTIPSAAPRPKKIVVLQPDELRTLFTSDEEIWFNQRRPSPQINAFRFAVLEGARRGEICGMQWADIHGTDWYVSRSIDHNQELTTAKTEESERIVTLHPRTMVLLEDQKKRAGDSIWVFPNPYNDGPMNSNNFYKAWQRYCQANNMSCSLHKLRHTFVSYAKADVPETLLKSMVGHTDSMDTYGIYGHDVSGDRARTAQILDSVFDKFLPKVGSETGSSAGSKVGSENEKKP